MMGLIFVGIISNVMPLGIFEVRIYRSNFCEKIRQIYILLAELGSYVGFSITFCKP